MKSNQCAAHRPPVMLCTDSQAFEKGTSFVPLWLRTSLGRSTHFWKSQQQSVGTYKSCKVHDRTKFTIQQQSTAVHGVFTIIHWQWAYHKSP